MSGWVQHLDGHWEDPSGVIGVVVAAKFPEPELIREKLEEGIARVPADTVWVIRGARKRNDAVSVAWDVLEEHGIEPLIAVSNTAHWETAARAWRDYELLNTCERVIVFHDTSSNVTELFVDRLSSVAKVYKIERGKKKPKQRKRGRAPVGAYDARDAGIARVAAGSDPQWKLDFEQKVRDFAAGGEPFTYEDVLLQCPPPQGSKAQGCAFVMTRLRKQGVIEWTGKVAPATRLTRNVGDMKVWVGV